jgi:uncharacterized zinc-type alcohol dehydrogenase-like protein
MRHWCVTKGKKVGVVGLGGLGHMVVKCAHALGAHVVVFTTSPGKKDDALRLGADEVVVSRDANQTAQHTGSFDFILDAVSADHDINANIQLLRRDGNITLVGAPGKPFAVAAFGLLFGRRSLSGSPIGGLPKTQEMLDFCGANNITADVEVIPIQKVNEAYERPVQGRREISLFNRYGFPEIRVTGPAMSLDARAIHRAFTQGPDSSSRLPRRFRWYFYIPPSRNRHPHD